MLRVGVRADQEPPRWALGDGEERNGPNLAESNCGKELPIPTIAKKIRHDEATGHILATDEQPSPTGVLNEFGFKNADWHDGPFRTDQPEPGMGKKAIKFEL